jgi:hypothetical protein
MKTLTAHLLTLLLCASSTGYADQKTPHNNKENHPPAEVKIEYRNQDGCSFMYSPINFCDEKHVRLASNAIKDNKPNFNNGYILISIPERPAYHQYSVIAINPSTGSLYPIPIDSYSGTPSKSNTKGENGKLAFGLDSNKVCIAGDILVYRSIKTGEFCFFCKKRSLLVITQPIWISNYRQTTSANRGRSRYHFKNRYLPLAYP